MRTHLNEFKNHAQNGHHWSARYDRNAHPWRHRLSVHTKNSIIGKINFTRQHQSPFDSDQQLCPSPTERKDCPRPWRPEQTHDSADGKSH